MNIARDKASPQMRLLPGPPRLWEKKPFFITIVNRNYFHLLVKQSLDLEVARISLNGVVVIENRHDPR
jgi:hypothetical protein